MQISQIATCAATLVCAALRFDIYSHNHCFTIWKSSSAVAKRPRYASSEKGNGKRLPTLPFPFSDKKMGSGHFCPGKLLDRRLLWVSFKALGPVWECNLSPPYIQLQLYKTSSRVCRSTHWLRILRLHIPGLFLPSSSSSSPISRSSNFPGRNAQTPSSCQRREMGNAYLLFHSPSLARRWGLGISALENC